MKPSDDVTPPLASRYVRSLLLRHKVPAIRHTAYAAEILGFTYSQVYRRMNGSVAWEIEEILRIAEHFGESLASVFAEGNAEPVVAAWLALGETRISCDLVLGGEVREPPADALVATLEGARWTVNLAAQAPRGVRHAVLRLELKGAMLAKRVAILDDDADEAMSMADFFVQRGCEADAFTSIEALIEEMTKRRYDAYVLDWILSEGSSAELVAMIRADDASCPIAIRTGRIESDSQVEVDVAEALAVYRLMYFQKPTMLPLITSQLLRALSVA